MEEEQLRNLFKENKNELVGREIKPSFTKKTIDGETIKNRGSIKITGIGGEAIKYNYSHPSKYKFDKNSEFMRYEKLERITENDDFDALWTYFVEEVQELVGEN